MALAIARDALVSLVLGGSLGGAFRGASNFHSCSVSLHRDNDWKTSVCGSCAKPGLQGLASARVRMASQGDESRSALRAPTQMHRRS